MKNRFWILIAFLVLLSMSCTITFGGTGLTGSGKVITETRNVSGFHAVDLAGFGELSITQGDSEALTVEGEDNILPKITTEVKNGTLTIGVDQSAGPLGLNPTRTVRYTLTVKDLDRLDLTGSGNIHSSSLKSTQMTITMSGSGNITLDKLEATDLSVTLSGSGNVDTSGTVTSQTVRLSGSGSYRAGNLKSGKTDVTITGSGSATVWATDSLQASISGSGSVDYYGSPQSIDKSVSGSGSIHSRGSK